jgi:hypothetical protein
MERNIEIVQDFRLLKEIINKEYTKSSSEPFIKLL